MTATLPASGTAQATHVVTGGSSGSAYTLDCSGFTDLWLTLTLTANCTVTLTNRAAGTRARLLVTQDATGGRSLTISDGTNTAAVSIPTAALAFAAVDCNCPDTTAIYASSLSVPGGQGIQGATGATGATGPSGGGANFEDPNGFSAVSGDMLLMALSQGILTAGTVHLTKVPIQTGFTCSKIVAQVQTAGATLTASQCFAAIFDTTGARLGITADQSAVWNSTGEKQMSLVSSAVLASPFVWVALLSNGTTQPTFFSANASTLTNVATTNATARAGTAGTAQTSMPASVTPASIVKATPAFAIGLL